MTPEQLRSRARAEVEDRSPAGRHAFVVRVSLIVLAGIALLVASGCYDEPTAREMEEGARAVSRHYARQGNKIERYLEQYFVAEVWYPLVINVHADGEHAFVETSLRGPDGMTDETEICDAVLSYDGRIEDLKTGTLKRITVVELEDADGYQIFGCGPGFKRLSPLLTRPSSPNTMQTVTGR